MDSRKIVGIIFIILGLLFIVSPLTSLIAVSLVAGISLIAFGLMTIIDGFSLFSRMAGISGLKIVLGILALILGALFIFHIDALSFIVGFQFYLIAFVLIFIGIAGIFSGPDAKAKVISLLILIMGIITIFLAAFSIANPLFVAILVGISLIFEGVSFILTSPEDY